MGPLGALWCQVGESHYDEQGCGGETEEKEKQSGSHAVERGGMEEIKADVGGLLAIQGHGDIQVPGCCQRTGWIHDPTRARVYVAIHGPCCPPKATKMPMFGLPPVAM